MKTAVSFRFLSALLLTICWYAAIPLAPAADSETPVLKMKMDVQVAKGELVLVTHIRVDKKVSLYKADLPWGNMNSLIIIAMAVNPGREELQQTYMCDNPGAAEVTLEKGREYVGAVPLKAHFGDLESIVRQRDVILFWSYEMRLADGAVLPRQGGYLLLKKRE